MLKTCQHNALQYRYVLNDNWFSSAEDMKQIKLELHKEFIMAVKANRTVALSLEHKQQGRYVRVDTFSEN